MKQDHMTLAECAAQLGVTENTVRSIQNKGADEVPPDTEAAWLLDRHFVQHARHRWRWHTRTHAQHSSAVRR